MNNHYKRGMLCGVIGALITLVGDILIGANPASGITTGAVMLDSFIDAVGNSDIRLVIGGLLGAVGISVTGIGYFQLYTLFQNEKGILPKIYKLAGFSVIAFAGAGVHMPCAVIPLLYKWIAPTDEQLAVTVAEKYANYFVIPLIVLFGVPLFLALLYQAVIIAKGRTAYPKIATLYNMAVGAVAATILTTLIGHNVIGGAIGTGSISIGHLWMFGMMLWKMPKHQSGGDNQNE